MKKHLRNALLPFILMALASFVILVIVDAMADYSLTSIVASTLLIIVSFIVSALAIWMVARDGMMRNDRFLMLNTHLAIGLLIFAIGEVTSIILSIIGETPLIVLLSGVVQLVAVALWAEGVLVYLSSTNQILGFSKNKFVIPLVFVIITCIFIVVQGLPVLYLAQQYPIEVVLAIPIESGLAIIIFSMLVLLWFYRRGYLAIPTVLTIMGTTLVLARTMLWGYQILDIVSPTSQIVAGAAYLLLGASLSFKSEELAQID